MITLTCPQASENYYLLWGSLLIGPMAHDGGFSPTEITFRSASDFLTENRGLYKENDVEHLSASGKLLYCPAADNAIFSPVYFAQWPRAVYASLVDSAKTASQVFAAEGVLSPGQIGMVTRNLAMGQWIHRGVEFDGANWHIYTANSTYNSPFRLGGWTHTILRFSGSLQAGKTLGCVCNQYSYNKSNPGFETAIDWSKDQTLSTLKGVTTSSVSLVTATPWNATYSGYHTKTLVRYTTDALREIVDAEVAAMAMEGFPLPLKHFGDLAAEAAEQASGSKVNMLSFLRDMRHPTEMIPKLKNLRYLRKEWQAVRRLKSFSDDFLVVKYGILPTIDDLRNIWGIVKGLKPYYDKNGFSTYSSGYTANGSDGITSYQAVQHVKLAIDNEDSAFDSIVERCDKWGVLPTGENLWDLVPYSFVIDWFIDIGDFLARMDSIQRIARLNIRYVTMSQKTIIRRPMSYLSSIVGELSWGHYHRWVSDQCPVPPLSLSTNPKISNHWLEAGALIIQRL